ncbi:conserved hypothetical protein [Ricinus communis]|uniref:Uncharacterized protein n=1 Tax=Ricinus communis TaxID=3988 RepID=B9RU85_RICCO|nr:conserved hypothetical protein [Ricinus communis]
MGLKREELLACLSVLLLIISQLQASCFAVGYGKFSRFRGGSSGSGSDHHHLSASANSRGIFKENAHNNNNNKDPDEIFGAEKRKVYTGPNPLHNR